METELELASVVLLKIPKLAAVFSQCGRCCCCLNRTTQTRHDIECVSNCSLFVVLGSSTSVCGWAGSSWVALGALKSTTSVQTTIGTPSLSIADLHQRVAPWGNGCQLYIPTRAAVACLHTHITSVRLCQGI